MMQQFRRVTSFVTDGSHKTDNKAFQTLLARAGEFFVEVRVIFRNVFLALMTV